MLSDVELPLEFWAIAAETATYFHNKMSQRQRKSIPEEDWYGKPVRFDHLRAFGCAAYVLIPKEKWKKLDQTAWKGIFVEYIKNSIYKIWNLELKQVVLAISVRCNEKAIGAEARKVVKHPPAELREESDEQSVEIIMSSEKQVRWGTIIRDPSTLVGGISSSQREEPEQAITPELLQHDEMATTPELPERPMAPQRDEREQKDNEVNEQEQQDKEPNEQDQRMTESSRK